MTSSAINKKLEIDKKLENKLEIYKNLEIKLEIYKNLEIKLEIYSYFKIENKLEIFEFFVNGRWSQYVLVSQSSLFGKCVASNKRNVCWINVPCL